MNKIVFHTIIYCLAACLLLFVRATPVTAAARDVTAESVLQAVNSVRRESGLSTLTMNEKLNNAAVLKANDMTTYRYWAHTNPTTNQTGWDFIQQTGYHYTNAGENLAKDYRSVASVMTGWLNSPTHKSVMLSDRYTETGIAVVYYTQDGVEKAVVVELFARPYQAQSSTGSLKLALATLLKTFSL